MFKNIQNQLARKFLTSLVFTFGIIIGVVLVAGGVIAGIKALSRPPSIPTHVEILMPENVSEETDGETDAVRQPQVLGIMERKPFFYTFLFFAIDEGNNSDVVIIGAFDTENKQAYIINIPRDTRIDVDRNLRKPVASYSAGRRNGGGHEGGVEQLAADMRTIFGFTPDFYVSVNEQAFVRIIDSVGGVTVTVPFNMRYDDPTQNLHINLSEGTQTLDGRRAIHFARYRMGNSGYRTVTDYQRIEHQQQIIRGMYDELLSPRTIARIPELLSIYREFVHTDLTVREQLWFAERFRGTTLSMFTLPTTGTSGSPGWYELPDQNAILELINETVNPFTQDITAEMVSIIEQ